MINKLFDELLVQIAKNLENKKYHLLLDNIEIAANILKLCNPQNFSAESKREFWSILCKVLTILDKQIAEGILYKKFKYLKKEVKTLIGSANLLIKVKFQAKHSDLYQRYKWNDLALADVFELQDQAVSAIKNSADVGTRQCQELKQEIPTESLCQEEITVRTDNIQNNLSLIQDMTDPSKIKQLRHGVIADKIKNLSTAGLQEKLQKFQLDAYPKLINISSNYFLLNEAFEYYAVIAFKMLVTTHVVELTNWRRLLDSFIEQLLLLDINDQRKLNAKNINSHWRILHLYYYLFKDKQQFPVGNNLILLQQATRSTASEKVFALQQAVAISMNYNKRPPDNPIQAAAQLLEEVLIINRAPTAPAPVIFDVVSYRKQLLDARKLFMQNPTVEAQKVFADFSQELLQNLFATCVQLLGPAPCDVALLLFGSSSRQDRAPHSDIEVALVYGNSNPLAQKIPVNIYTAMLHKLLDLAVISLGESTTEGYRIDVSTNGSKIGAVQTFLDSYVINTLQSMGIYALDEPTVYMLLSPVLVNTSGAEVFRDYKEYLSVFLNQQAPEAQWRRFIHKFKLPLPVIPPENLTYRQLIAFYCLYNVMENSFNPIHSEYPDIIDLKTNYYMPLVYLALNLRLYYNLTSIHPYDILQEVGTKRADLQSQDLYQLFPWDLLSLYCAQIPMLLEIRTQLHKKCGRQHELLQGRDLAAVFVGKDDKSKSPNKVVTFLKIRNDASASAVDGETESIVKLAQERPNVWNELNQVKSLLEIQCYNPDPADPSSKPLLLMPLGAYFQVSLRADFILQLQGIQDELERMGELAQQGGVTEIEWSQVEYVALNDQVVELEACYERLQSLSVLPALLMWDKATKLRYQQLFEKLKQWLQGLQFVASKQPGVLYTVKIDSQALKVSAELQSTIAVEDGNLLASEHFLLGNTQYADIFAPEKKPAPDKNSDSASASTQPPKTAVGTPAIQLEELPKSKEQKRRDKLTTQQREVGDLFDAVLERQVKSLLLGQQVAKLEQVYAALSGPVRKKCWQYIKQHAAITKADITDLRATTLQHYPTADGDRPGVQQQRVDFERGLIADLIDGNANSLAKASMQGAGFEIDRFAGNLVPEVCQLLLNVSAELVEDRPKDIDHSHLVKHITIANKTYYFKFFPELPGRELAVSQLYELMLGYGVSKSMLVKITIKNVAYPVLISEGITGAKLNEQLRATPNLALDPKIYTQLFLMSLFSLPEDAKPNNFIWYTANGISFPVGIDNDRVFGEPTKVEGRFFKTTNVIVKTIIFCLDQMHEQLDSEAIKEFLALNPKLIFERWFASLTALQTKLTDIFTAAELQAWSKSTEDKTKYQQTSYAYIQLPLDVIGRLYPRISSLLETLRHSLQESTKTVYIMPTHFNLLGRLTQPKVADYYSRLFVPGSNAKSRFESIQLNNTSYTPTPVGPMSTPGPSCSSIGTREYAENIDPNKDVVAGKSISLAACQERLKKLVLDYQRLPLIINEVEQGNTAGLTALLPILQLKVIERLHWEVPTFSPATQKTVLEKLYSAGITNECTRLNFSSCQTLYFNLLWYILQVQSQLRVLNLSRCDNIFDLQFFKSPLPAMENLQSISISDCANIKTLTLPYLPKLTVLKIKNCPKLEQVTMSSPPIPALGQVAVKLMLKVVDISNCPALNTLDLPLPPTWEMSKYQFKDQDYYKNKYRDTAQRLFTNYRGSYVDELLLSLNRELEVNDIVITPELDKKLDKFIVERATNVREIYIFLRNIFYDRRDLIGCVLAARTLIEFGIAMSDVQTRLLALLKNQDLAVRWEAIRVLGTLGSATPEVQVELLALLEDQDSIVRNEAVNALGRLGSAVPEVQSRLLVLLGDHDVWVRFRVAEVLGDLGLAMPEVQAGLLVLLENEDLGIRLRAAQALGYSGLATPEVQTCLLSLLKDNDSSVRELAIGAFGDIGLATPEVQAELLALLEDHDVGVRLRAAKALIKFGLATPEVQAVLLWLLKYGAPVFRCQAAGILGKLGLVMSEVQAGLLELLRDKSIWIRLLVLEVLGRLGPATPEVQVGLLASLKDKDPWVRRQAVEVLVALKLATPEVQVELLALSKDRYTYVRVMAITADKNIFLSQKHFTNQIHQIIKPYIAPNSQVEPKKALLAPPTILPTIPIGFFPTQPKSNVLPPSTLPQTGGVKAVNTPPIVATNVGSSTSYKTLSSSIGSGGAFFNDHEDVMSQHINGDETTLASCAEVDLLGYWYSITDVKNLMHALRRGFDYKMAGGGDYHPPAAEELYVANRENAEQVMLADPHVVGADFANAFMGEIHSITGRLVDELVARNNPWEHMPLVVVIPILHPRHRHWRSIRVTMDYTAKQMHVLWDDPFGAGGFSTNLKNEIEPTLRVAGNLLLQTETQQADSEVTVFELDKPHEQQDNGCDCGVITVANCASYINPALSNIAFVGDVANYNVSNAGAAGHKEQMLQLRQEHKNTFIYENGVQPAVVIMRTL